MKFTVYLKQFMLGMLTLLISCILSACGGVGSCLSCNNNGGPISLGVLPNGSTVYTSISTFPVSDGNSISAVLSLVGGTPGSSFKISFGDSVLQGVQKRSTNASLQNMDSNGITITPRFCILGTVGSGESASCAYNVLASENTAPGTYTVTPYVSVNNEIIQTLNPITVLVSAPLTQSSRSITSYSLNGTAGVITGQNIAVTMPYGTDVSSLVATYITTGVSVAVGSAIQVNGSTTNDFSSQIIYTVTAENGLTENYTVTVTVAADSAKAITAFSLEGNSGVIIGQNIYVTMPYGTNLSALGANFNTSGVSVTVNGVNQVNNGATPNNFTNPVVYKVHAANGTTQDYTVTVTTALNTAKAIISFSLSGTPGLIIGQNIYVTMPYGTNVSALGASFNTSGVSVTVNSVTQVNNGLTQNNFTNPVRYTVHAANGTTQYYSVTVTLAANTAKALTAFSLGGASGLIIGQNIYVTMPYGTNVSALGASFNTSGANVTVGSVTQVNGGATPNDFTNPVIYTVHAADGTTQNYTVTVTVALSPDKAITAFALNGVSGIIIGQNIAVNMPYGTDIRVLGANFNTSGANVTVGSVIQVDGGATPNDFTNPVIYTVHAADGTTQDYTVTVTVALSPDKSITAFALNGVSGIITGQNIAVNMPYGTDVSALGASFNTSGANVTVGGVTQVNGGATPNDFANPVIYTVRAADGTTQDYTVTVTVALNPDKSITAFALNGVSGTIIGQNIAVTMPYGTNVSALGANFNTSGASVTVGSVTQVNSGATPNNFTNPVIYTVHAADGTTQDYTVTVTVALNSAKNMLSFALNGIVGTITEQNIAVVMPYGTNVSALIASFTTSGDVVTVSGVSQVTTVTANNFIVPVVYTVHAADGTTQDYTVTVTVALNSAKNMLSFALNGTIGTITGQNIAVVMPYGTSVSALIASFTTSGDVVTVSGVSQVATVTANNFTGPVFYTVTAADGSTQSYTVTVTVAPNSAKTITAFALNGTAGTITGQNIAVVMPFGTTNVTALIATFTASSGAQLTVASTPQISGVTPNNFTSPVVYTVTAADGSRQDYNVTVTVASSSAKSITSYSIAGMTGVFTGQSIAVIMPSNTTNVTALIATFTISAGAQLRVSSTPQTSGVTPNNFTSPVVYTVTAADGSTQNYTVTVSVQSSLSTPYGIVLNRAGTIAFVTSFSSNRVSYCNLNSGSFLGCTNTGGTGFNYPVGIALNNAGTLAYVASYYSGVSYCNVSGGSLSGCTDTGGTGFNGSVGIAFNSDETVAYIVNNVSNSVSSCTVNGGVFSACANTGGTGFDRPIGIALNSAGTIAYIASDSGGIVTACSVNGRNFSSCANSGGTGFNHPYGVTLNSAGTIAFVVNHGNNVISSCAVNGMVLSSCVNSGGTGFNAPTSMALNSAGNAAYVTNGGSNTISKCTVSGGTLSACN